MTNLYKDSTFGSSLSLGCPKSQRPRGLLFGFLGSGIFGWRRDLAHGASKRFLVTIGAMLARGVDELLALGSGVGLFSFGFGHGVNLRDLLACREVRHV